MTLVSSIINDALRETNIIPLGKAPSDAENVEGLRRLQTIVLSVLGNEAGDNLVSMPLGSNEIESPGGYPWYGNEFPGNAFLPANKRVMANLNGPGRLFLTPNPDEGARFAVVDVSQNFFSYNLEILGNGRSIEGEDAITLAESGFSGEWFYRGDLGNWMKVKNLVLTDELPFPPEFDDMFIIMLAARINPRYGQQLDPASSQMLQRARTQFRARYTQDTQMPVEDALLYMSGDYRYGGRYQSRNYGDSNNLFNTGYPF